MKLNHMNLVRMCGAKKWKIKENITYVDPNKATSWEDYEERVKAAVRRRDGLRKINKQQRERENDFNL